MPNRRLPDQALVAVGYRRYSPLPNEILNVPQHVIDQKQVVSAIPPNNGRRVLDISSIGVGLSTSQ